MDDNDEPDGREPVVSRRAPFVTAVLGIPALWGLGLLATHHRVEEHLADRHPGVRASFDGKDATLPGTAPAPAPATSVPTPPIVPPAVGTRPAVPFGTVESLSTQLAAVGDVRFEFDSAGLTDTGGWVVGQLAEVLRAAPGDVVIEVTGYADSRGSDAYNLMLSRQRADSVTRGLIDRGVDLAILKGRALGEAAPVASNATAAGRALNRRVHLRVSTPADASKHQ